MYIVRVKGLSLSRLKPFLLSVESNTGANGRCAHAPPPLVRSYLRCHVILTALHLIIDEGAGLAPKGTEAVLPAGACTSPFRCLDGISTGALCSESLKGLEVLKRRCIYVPVCARAMLGISRRMRLTPPSPALPEGRGATGATHG